MLNKKRLRFFINTKNKSFIYKLYDILNENKWKEIIHWNNSGTYFLIKDINKLCEIILPEYSIHNNYSSFVRKLNIYGFHKIKGIKDSECFEHKNFNKNTKLEEIKRILKQNKSKKPSSNSNKNDRLNYYKEKLTQKDMDLMLYLLNQNKQIEKNINDLKKDFKEIKSESFNLNNKFQRIKCIKGKDNIILENILEQKRNNNNITNKVNDLKELFIKYINYLKIFNPFITVNNKKNNNFQIEKKESFIIQN